jgi:hypothetical protein
VKIVSLFGWVTAAFGAFAAIMVLTSLAEQTAGDATIRFLASAALALVGVVIAVRGRRRPVPRIDDAEAEREILTAARAHEGRITAIEVAAKTRVPLAQATELLEALNRRGLCRMSVADVGILVFEFPELEHVAAEAGAEAEEAPGRAAQRARDAASQRTTP